MDPLKQSIRYMKCQINDQVLITVITAYELLKGARLSSKPEDNLKDVKEAISNMQVLDFSPEACEEASSIFCELKKIGQNDQRI